MSYAVRLLASAIPVTQAMKSEPTEEQRRLFGEMMYRAFLEMRGLGFQGKSDQVQALADAFHNLPIAMFQPDFDWDMSRVYFESYHAQYPVQSGAASINYVAMHDHIQAAA